MTTRIGTAGTYNTGDLISASDINSMPGGTIGKDTATADSTGTVGTETVCTTAPTVGAGRELTISFTVNLRATAASGAFAAIFEDGVQLQRKNISISATGTDTPLHLSILSEDPGAGAHTYTGVTGVSGGGGATVTCSNNGYTGTRGVTQLRVVDSGPNF